MEDTKKKIKSPYLKAMFTGFGALAMAIVLFLLIYKFSAVKDAAKSLIQLLRPFIIGGAFAYLISPVCNGIEKWLNKKLPEKAKGWSNGISITASTVIFILIVYLLIIMIIPQMIDSIAHLMDSLPSKVEALIPQIEEKLANNENLLNYLSKTYETVKSSLESWVEEKLMPSMSDYIKGFGSGVLSAIVTLKDTLIGFVAMVYFLISRKTFARQAKKLLYGISGKKWGDIISAEAKFADTTFSGFLTGKIIDSAIIGVLCYIFCLIADMPDPLLISGIIGLTNIIPVFGPFIGAIPSSLLILVYSPAKCLWFVIFTIILQQVDGNIIGPKILGDAVGISSFWILFSIILFGGWFGFIGMIIGVPLFVVIYDIITKLVNLSLAKKGIEESFFEPACSEAVKDIQPGGKSIEQ